MSFIIVLERESCNKDVRRELFLVVHNLQMDGPFLGSYTGQHYNHCENIIHFAALVWPGLAVVLPSSVRSNVNIGAELISRSSQSVYSLCLSHSNG